MAIPPKASFQYASLSDFEAAVHYELDAWHEAECQRADDAATEGTEDE